METNFLVIAAAALIPLVMGFIWYNPKVFGTAWMQGAGLTEEQIQKGPKPTVFIFSYILSFMAAYLIYMASAHVFGLGSLFATEPGFDEAGSAVHTEFNALVERFSDKDRNFGHGFFHGVILSLFIAFPVLATNGMFEMKTWKHNLINVAYWVVTFGLMGGVVCQFA